MGLSDLPALLFQPMGFVMCSVVAPRGGDHRWTNRHGKTRFVCSRGPASPDDAGKRTAVSSSDRSSLGPADEEDFVKKNGVPDDPREAPSATSHAFHDERRAGFFGRKASRVAAAAVYLS